MRLLLASVCLLLLPYLALADATQTQLLELDSAFVQGHYSQVELLGLRLLQGEVKLSPQERSHINLTTGYALIMMNRETEARGYFRNALDAEPNLVLDPVQVSPKFRMVFDDVKASYQNTKGNSQTSTPPSLHPPVQSAMLSNLILPGGGQWREGNHVRGAVYFLAEAGSVVLLVSQIQRMHDSHENYLAQTDPLRIRDTYDTYNHDYSLAWAAGALTAAIYVAAQADLILIRPREKPVRVSASIVGSHRVGLTVNW